MGNKTTKIHKENPVVNGYYIVSESEDVLKSGYFDFPSGYDIVDWFLDEIWKLENRMDFYFKNNNKDNKMTADDEEDFTKIIICQFCEKEIQKDKVTDHCHLTGTYRDRFHQICKVNVPKKQRNLIPFAFHIFSEYDCHLFFGTLVDKKNNKVKFEITPKTKEEYISVTYGCRRFKESYRFLTSSLDELAKTMHEDDFKLMKKRISWKMGVSKHNIIVPLGRFQ